MIEQLFVWTGAKELHARPSAIFSKSVYHLKSEVTLELTLLGDYILRRVDRETKITTFHTVHYAEPEVVAADAKSIMDLVMIGDHLLPGGRFKIIADGPDEADVMEAIRAMLFIAASWDSPSERDPAYDDLSIFDEETAKFVAKARGLNTSE